MEHDLEYPKTMSPSLTTFNLMKLLWMTVSRQTLKGTLDTIKFPIVQPARRSRLILPGNVLSLEAAQNERTGHCSLGTGRLTVMGRRQNNVIYLSTVYLFIDKIDNLSIQVLNLVRKAHQSTYDTMIIFWRDLSTVGAALFSRLFHHAVIFL